MQSLDVQLRRASEEALKDRAAAAAASDSPATVTNQLVEESESSKSWAAAGFSMMKSDRAPDPSLVKKPAAAAPAEEAPAVEPMRGYGRKNHAGGRWVGNGRLRWLVVEGYSVKYYKDHHEQSANLCGTFDLRNVAALRPSRDPESPGGTMDIVMRGGKIVKMLLPSGMGTVRGIDWLKYFASAVPASALPATEGGDEGEVRRARACRARARAMPEPTDFRVAALQWGCSRPKPPQQPPTAPARALKTETARTSQPSRAQPAATAPNPRPSARAQAAHALRLQSREVFDPSRRPTAAPKHCISPTRAQRNFAPGNCSAGPHAASSSFKDADVLCTSLLAPRSVKQTCLHSAFPARQQLLDTASEPQHLLSGGVHAAARAQRPASPRRGPSAHSGSCRESSSGVSMEGEGSVAYPLRHAAARLPAPSAPSAAAATPLSPRRRSSCRQSATSTLPRCSTLSLAPNIA